MPRLIGLAPTRVDLAGGTIDIRPLTYVLDHRATVNFGISLRAKVEIETNTSQEFQIESRDQHRLIKGRFQSVIAAKELPLISELIQTIWNPSWPGLRILTSAESPAGAGLGGSSCLAVVIAACLFRMRNKITGQEEPDEASLVRFVQDVEARLIHCPTGCQDYWGAVRGGLNLIHFPPGDAHVESLRHQDLQYLRDRLILCFSGRSRASGINNWLIFKEVFEGNRNLIAKLNEIGLLTEQLCVAAKAGLWEDCLKLSLQEWMVRRQLWPSIETSETTKIDAYCKEAGAMFSRVCGAGGGGVMVIFAEPEQRRQVEEAAVRAGGSILPASLTNAGLEINDA